MKRRSGVTFLGNTEELNKEFTSMALGLGLDVHTYALPLPTQEADEGDLDRAQQDGMASQNHPADAPIQKRREGCQK